MAKGHSCCVPKLKLIREENLTMQPTTEILARINKNSHANKRGSIFTIVLFDAPIGKPTISATTGGREPVLQMLRIPTERFACFMEDIVRMEWIMNIEETNKTEHILYADDLRVGKAR